MKVRRVSSWLAMALALSAAGVAAQNTTVILVRHAEKAAEPANDPPLTEIGRKRAEDLLEVLRNAGVTRIYSTPFLRTMQTAEPLAKALALEVTTTAMTGGTQAFVQQLADRIRREAKGQTVLVVGHSNTTPLVISALGATPVPPIPDEEYFNFYVVSITPDGRASVIRAKY